MGRKKIKGQVYKFFRNSNGKYFYGKTIKEIKKKRNLYESAIQQSDPTISKQYFGDYVVNWLYTIKRPNVKRHTFDGYEDCIKGQLLNYKYYNLSDYQMGTITTDMIQEYYNSLAEHYSRGTIKKNYAILKQCIKYANKHEHFSLGMIELDEIVIPHEDIIQKKEREIHFLDQEDINKLYIESKRLNTQEENFGGKIGESTYGNNANAIIFILFTGLRIGELIDLKWNSINLDSNVPTLTVMSNNVKIKSRDKNTQKKYIDITSTPKTASGYKRTIPLNQQALEILQIEHDLNPNHTPSDYVFITKNGSKIQSRQNINRTLKAMMSRAGCSIDYLTPHELRHTFGSLLIKKGIDIKVVSNLLGHKDISVTYNIYIHILQEQRVTAVASLNDLITV